MKRTLIDILFGILLVVEIFIVVIVEGIFLMIYFGGEPPGASKYPTFDLQMFITAFIVLLTTYGFSGYLKTKSMAEAIKRGLIWTFLIALAIILEGYGSNHLELYFGRIGTYVLLLSAFSGTFIYAKKKKLE